MKPKILLASILLAIIANLFFIICMDNFSDGFSNLTYPNLIQTSMATGEQYGNDKYGDCYDCYLWDPYRHEYIDGLRVICYPMENRLCNDLDCVPGSCY